MVNITSCAVVRTGQGRTVQPRGTGSGFVLDAVTVLPGEQRYVLAVTLTERPLRRPGH